MSDEGPASPPGSTVGADRPDHDLAMAAGRQIDLSDCRYDESGAVQGYYSFLAGLVRSRGYRRIVEVGTHHGGSTMSLCRGIAEADTADACVVTIDITRFNEEGLARVPFLHRVQGDSLRPEIVDEVCGHFDGPIDLLYVDSFHQHRETLQNIALFANRLGPAVVVVDDIRINPSMRDLWSEVQALDGGVARDISSLVGRKSVGFGIIECDPTCRWPEVRGRRLTAWLLWRRTHRTLDRAVPERLQEAARPVLVRASALLRRR